jgi:hypothetical protein
VASHPVENIFLSWHIHTCAMQNQEHWKAGLLCWKTMHFQLMYRCCVNFNEHAAETFVLCQCM